MQAKERTRVLQQLAAHRQLQTRLAEPLPETDRFGEILREMLKTGSVSDLDRLSRSDLLATASAWEILSSLNLVTLDESKLRRLITQAEFLADYDALLEDGFLGREEQLNSLRDFLGGATDNTNPSRLNSMILTGLGGAGKSTLLAKFAREITSFGTATLVVLDFDRPAIDAGDTYWLEMEIARQVGCQYPDLDESLRHVRETIRHFKGDTEKGTASFTPEYASLERGFRSVIDGVRDALRSVSGHHRPILLILDTFEEVAQRDLIDRMINWLREIADRFFPIPLKVIFSGRLFDRALARLKDHGTGESLNVDALDPILAEQLLKQLDVPDTWARRLAYSEVLPRRPLELKLLARLIKSSGDESIDTLEEEIRNGGPAASELFAGLVYRRVLLRVSEEARSLAFPGLVLRYLTKELIQNVLVPALDLTPIDEESAGKALDALAGYEWLAYRQGDEVWHRKDLRRSMLKAMVAKERERARKINRQAVIHFSEESDGRSRSEAIYHRLMLADSADTLENLEHGELARANEHIGGDIVDLPPAAQALLRFAAGMEVRMDDVPLLPQKYRYEAYSSLGSRNTGDREFGLALRLIRTARDSQAQLLPWERETLFATGSWDELCKWPPKLEPGGFRRLAYAFYPAAIVAPEVLDPVMRERMLVETPRPSRFNLLTSERQTLLERFALGVVLANDYRALRRHEHDALSKLMSAIDQDEKNFPASPSTQRRFFLLDLICGSTNRERMVALTPFHVKLDPRWLRRASEITKRLADSTARNDMEAFIARVHSVLASSENVSARAMLGAVSALATAEKQLAEVWFPLTGLDAPDVLELLQGPDPEFRNPCRFALLNAFSGSADYAVLSKIFATSFPLPVADVQTDIFQSTVSTDPEHGLEAFVELADRSGTLCQVMQLACRAKPQSKQLAEVASAHERWRMAVRRLLTKSRETRILHNRKESFMDSDDEIDDRVDLTAHFLTTLRSGPRKAAGLEIVSDTGEVDLSDSAIKNRLGETEAELGRIIKDYLNDRPELYRVADEILKTGDTALRMLRDGDDQALRRDRRILASLETIVRVDGSRPSFLVRKGEVDRKSSPLGSWGNTLDASESLLTDAFSCVGRIDDPAAEQGFQGTGFLVAENLIVTNRHVLQMIAARDAHGVWQISPQVRIDFGHEFRGNESVTPRALKSVVFARPEAIASAAPIDHAKLDLVLIELAPAATADRPRTVLSVDIARDWAQPMLTTFVVGYAGNPGFDAFTPTLLEQLFKSTFGFKRVAPGLTMASQASVQPWTFAHDATTLGGNSGSVVLVAGRETIAAGLHYGGRRADPRENWGHVLGLTLDQTDGKSPQTLREVLKSRDVVLVDSLGG
ncbi:AAA family ATPase [Noviherbaspirillum saxi]|nr:AAA family ATPase [Noviherbaspirillum saxi]